MVNKVPYSITEQNALLKQRGMLFKNEQNALLKQRGMLFKNEQNAYHFLENISYYRLKGYWWDMQVYTLHT